jgi:putative membrane protein
MTIENVPEREKRQWFRVLLQCRASVIPAIIPRVLICSVFALFISLLHARGFKVSLPSLSSVVPSIVLGLLLVFRTNTAYERFWEGRKLWGTLVNTIRNLARTIWVCIEEIEAEDRKEKIKALRLLVAFAVATKLHLRSESVNSELEALMPKECYEKLKQMNNPPLEVAFWIGDYLQLQYERNCLNSYQLTAMFGLLNTMVDVLGGCERILKTPIPLAYAIHLKQLLLIYCLSLPFQMVMDLNWWTAIVVGVISFAVFGIEEIGIEIENPFGKDPNDLPLDRICDTMQRNIEDLISLSPSTSRRK